MATGDLNKIFGGTSGSVMIGEVVLLNSTDISLEIDNKTFLRSGFITRDFVEYPDALRSKSFATTVPSVMTPSVCAYSPALDICVSFPTVYTAASGTMLFAVSTDKGETWTNNSTSSVCQVLDCIWDNINSVFVAIGTDQNTSNPNKAACITSPDGYTWTRRVVDFRGVQLAQNPVTGTIIAWCWDTSTSGQEFWKSTNGGASWTQLTNPTGLLTSSTMEGISYSTIADKFIITQDTSNFEGMIITTSDEGVTWDYNQTDFLGNLHFPGKSVVDNTNDGLIYGFANDGDHVFTSTDAITWTLLTDASNGPSGNVLYLPSKNIFYSNSGYSEDGINWIYLENVSDVRYFVNIDDDYILATEGGILGNSDIGISAKKRLTIFDEYIGIPFSKSLDSTNLSLYPNNANYYVRIK